MHIARNIRSVLLAMCLLHASFANSANQTTSFKAILQANHENGDPLAHAQISAAGEAAPKTSGSDGLFVLEFPTKKPGDKISLHISKPGWRVLHPIMVERLLPAKQDVPDKILLCQEAQCDASVAEYFASKAVNGIKLDYEKRIAALKGEAKGASQGQLKAKDQQIPKLQQERDELLKKAPDAAAQLARVPQGAVSNAYLQAMELFRNGHIQAALEKLNEEEITAREEVINSALLKAKLQVLLGQFDAAQLQFEKVVQIDAQLLEAWLAYAHFLKQHRQISAARLQEAATALHNIGLVHHNEKRLPSALTSFEAALQVLRILAAQNRAAYLPNLAGTLSNLGNVNDRQHRQPEALAAYEEALSIRREMAAQNRAANLPDVAMTLSSLGRLHYRETRLPAAQAAYEEALKIYRELATQNRAVYLPLLATMATNLGNLHNRVGRMTEGLAMHEEALTMRRELVTQNRTKYLPDLAMTLYSIGFTHRMANNPAAALPMLEEALAHFRDLAAKNAKVFAMDLASTLTLLGDVHAAQQRPALARKAYEQAITTYREMSPGSPDIFADRIAIVEESLNQLPP